MKTQRNKKPFTDFLARSVEEDFQRFNEEYMKEVVAQFRKEREKKEKEKEQTKPVPS
jgi:hypothetical protein